MLPFTVEQENMISIYRSDTRLDTIHAIYQAYRFVLDKDTRNLMMDCIALLSDMSDEVYSLLPFSLTTFQPIL